MYRRNFTTTIENSIISKGSLQIAINQWKIVEDFTAKMLLPENRFLSTNFAKADIRKIRSLNDECVKNRVLKTRIWMFYEFAKTQVLLLHINVIIYLSRKRSKRLSVSHFTTFTHRLYNRKFKAHAMLLGHTST